MTDNPKTHKMDFPRDAEKIIADFAERNLTERDRNYLRFHRRRYEHLLRKIYRHLGKISPPAGPIRILDVGPYLQTDILRETLPNTIVDSLGLFAVPRSHPRAQDRHFQFDLNGADRPEKWPLLPKYGLIVMAEVIEHLRVSPKAVLTFFAASLNPGDCLIVQTPNACSLHKRLKMLIGINPFEIPGEDGSNPGHVREYTLKELIDIGRAAGFKAVEYSVTNYFGDSPQHKIYNGLARFFPRSWRSGITILFQKR